MAAVQPVILHPIVAFEQDKIGDAGHHRLTILRAEEFLQVVVAQRRVFDVDFPHDAYPDLGNPVDGNGGEIIGDAVELLPHMASPEAAGTAEILHQFLHPFPDPAVGFPLHQLVGAALIGHMDDDVAVQHGIGHLTDHVEIQGEAGIFLQTGQIHRYHGNVIVARPVQRLTQQVNVIGGPAAAARLRDEQPHLVGIVFPAFHRVDELADDQKGGVAGVIVDVFEPLVHNSPMGGGEHIHREALQLEHPFQHGEMDRQHLRHKQGVFPLHFFCEQQATLLVVYQFCHGKTLPFCLSHRGGDKHTNEPKAEGFLLSFWRPSPPGGSGYGF